MVLQFLEINALAADGLTSNTALATSGPGPVGLRPRLDQVVAGDAGDANPRSADTRRAVDAGHRYRPGASHAGICPRGGCVTRPVVSRVLAYRDRRYWRLWGRLRRYAGRCLS
jgi:hypothetical protein